MPFVKLLLLNKVNVIIVKHPVIVGGLERNLALAKKKKELKKSRESLMTLPRSKAFVKLRILVLENVCMSMPFFLIWRVPPRFDFLSQSLF